MTRFLAYLGAALLGLLPLNGQMLLNPYALGAGGGPPSSTLKDSNTAASSSTTTFGNGANLKYIGSGFVSGATPYTLTSVDVYMSKTGNPSFNISCEIWSNNSGDPGSIQGTGSTNTISASGLTGTETVYTFTGLNASISATTTYFIVLICDTVGNGTDNVQLHRNAVSGNQIDTSPDGSTWNNASGTRRSKFATYGY